MKRYFLVLMIALLPLFVSAQQLRFGYFSFKDAFQSMPEYAVAQKNLDILRSKYDAETKRVEEEFNKDYEEFLDGQKDFAPSILKKRQNELRELMEKNIAFKEESIRLLKQAENDAYAPLKTKLNQVLQRIGKEKGYIFILNTDAQSVPYIDSYFGEDINTLVQTALK